MTRTGAPLKRWQKTVAVTATLLAVMILVPLGWYQVSVQPGALLVKTVFESAPMVKAGPGVALARDSVHVQKGIRVVVEDAPEASVDVYVPQTGVSPRPLVLWIHGGGFISNSASDVAGYASVLADAGYTVAALDYSLAPAQRHPVPVLQANAAVGYLVDHAEEFGIDSSRIFIGGDSAGANIAAETVTVLSSPAIAQDRGITASVPPDALRGAILFCGLYDMETVAETGFPALRTFLWAYTGHRDWLEYDRIDELSTTTAATSAYPPTLLTVGDADPFASQAYELAARLTRVGVPVTAKFWNDTRPGLGHEYQFDFELPEARETLQETLGFLADHSEDTP